MSLRLSVAENPQDIPKSFMERLMDDRVGFGDEVSSSITRHTGTTFRMLSYPVLSGLKGMGKLEERHIDVFIDRDESAVAFVLDDKAAIQMIEGAEALKGVLPEILADREARVVYKPVSDGPPEMRRIVSRTKGINFEPTVKGGGPAEWVDLKDIGIDFEDFVYIADKQPATLKADMKKYMEREELDIGYVDEYLSKSMRGTEKEKAAARKRFYNVLVREIKEMQGIVEADKPDVSTTGTTTAATGGSEATRISFSPYPGKGSDHTGSIGLVKFVEITGRSRPAALGFLKYNGIDPDNIPLEKVGDYIDTMRRVSDGDRVAARQRFDSFVDSLKPADPEQIDRTSDGAPELEGEHPADVAGQLTIEQSGAAAATEVNEAAVEEFPILETVARAVVVEPAQDVLEDTGADGISEDTIDSVNVDEAPDAAQQTAQDVLEDSELDGSTSHTEVSNTPGKGYTLFEFLKLSGLNATDAMGVIESEGINFAHGKLDSDGVEGYLERVGKLTQDSMEPAEQAAGSLGAVEEGTVSGVAQPGIVVQDISPAVDQLETGANQVLNFVGDEKAGDQATTGEDLDDSLVDGETGGLDIGEAQEESYQDDLAVDGTEGKGSPARKSDVYRLKKVAGVLGIDEWDVKHLVEIGRLKPVTVAGQHSGTTYFAREDVLRLKAEKVEADIGRKVYTRSQATQVLGGDKTALQRGVAKRTIRTYHDRFFDMEDINTLADELGVTPVIDDSKSLGQEVEAALAGIEEPSNTLNQVLEPPATQKRVYSYNQARDALDVPPRDFHNVLIAGGVEKVAGGYDADQIDELAKKRRERIEACVVDQKHGEARQDREPARLPTTLAQPEATKTRRYTEDQAASALCVTEGIFRSLAEVNNIPFEDGGYDADRIDRLKRELEKHNTTRVTEQNVNQPQNSHIKDIARKYGVTRSQADKLLREGGVERSTVTYYPTKEADELFSRLGYKPVSEGSDAGSRKATDLETDAQKVLEAIGSKTDGPVEVAPSKGVGLYSLGETAEALQMDKPGVMALVNGHKIRMKIVDGKICFERGEVARFGSEHGIEVAYVNQNIPAPKPEPIISDIGSTVIVENQDAPDPSAEDFDDSVSVESLAAPSAEELDDGAGEVLGAVGDGLVSALDGTNGLTLVEDVDVVDEDAQITPDDSKHIYTDSPLVTAWTGEKGSCKLYDIEMFYGLTRADVKDRLKEAGLWTAKPSQTFNRRDVAEKFAEAGIEPNPFVGLPAITDRERANLGRPPKAPEVPRDQTPERSRGEETEYRRPDGKHEQPTGQPRPHDIQRKYGLGAKEAHDLLQDNGIAPDVTISETVGLYSQDRVDGFFESRGIRPVGDSDKRDREAAVLPSIDAPVAESGVRKKIEPVGGRQQGVDKPAAQQALQKPEEMSTEKTHDRKIIDKPSPPVGFYGASKVYTPPPRVPDIYKPLRDSILSRLERERHTYFGVVDKSDIAQVLKAGGSMVSDSGTVFVAPDQVERVFGHGYERLRAMLAWQGLETDPIKGVNSEHMRKFIERDITKLNPKIADRMLVEFGYKQDVASVGGGVSECVDVNSDDVKDVIGCVQELTPHISPPVKADVEKPETENTGNNSIIDQGEPDLKIDDKPSLLGQKGKDEKSDEERDYQGEYYKGAFKGSVSLGKLRSIIGDRKTADRIGERYGQDGRVDNSVLARLASGLEDSELGAVQRERILLDMGIPTDTERAKGIVERYCPEIRHADRRREVVVFDPMEDYTLGDYSRMGLKREELDLIKKGSQGSVPGWRAAEILVSGWQLDVVRSTFGYSGNVGEIRGRIDKQKADYGRGRRS